jgi:flavin-dependent dehydrogenase
LSTVTPKTFAERFPGLASEAGSDGIAALLGALDVHDADAGEALMAEGTPTDEVFLVIDGRLDITMRGAAGERRLAQVGPGSYFGEVSLLDPGKAGASVVTEQGCVTLRVSREGLDELHRSNPAAAGALLGEVLRSLSARMRAASAELGEVRYAVAEVAGEPAAEPIEALRSDAYLGELDADTVAALAAAVEVEELADGAKLLESGDPGEALLLVLTGEVVTGVQGVDRHLGPGSWLGGLAGIQVGPPLAGATAAGTVRLTRLSWPAYRALDTEHPSLRAALCLSIGTQLAREFRGVSEGIRARIGRAAVAAEAKVSDYDVVVIGAGPHAIAYAAWIKQDRPETRIALVEKRAAPGFKIGESTLGPVIRAWMSLGMPLPAQRRLFNNKLGLHFWWTGAETDGIHAHIDQVVEETFQVERRVLELFMLNVARRAGIDVYQGTRVLIDESRIEGQPKELVCESSAGDVLRFRSRIVCDASGPAAVIGRHLGIRHKNPEFNTNAYFGYFRKKSDVDLPTWDVAATRHLCFPEAWVWFIELASWEQASDDSLNALVDHLLDIGAADEDSYPTRFELAERFGAPLEQFPVSIGVVPRTDIDTAAELPFEERFQHYVSRYPAFKRIMDTHELIEAPYEGHPPYVAYTDLVQHSERYAGDGWLLIGDAAYFVNPLYSPGMTYGHSLASFAAQETVNALERGDFSEEAFTAFDEGARTLYTALVTECEFFYRSFRHQDAFERAFMMRPAFFMSIQHEFIQRIGGVRAMRRMFPRRPPGPAGEAIVNPRFQQLMRQVVDADRELEARAAPPDETAAVFARVLDPLFEDVRAIDGVAALELGQAFQNYDDQLRRVPSKPNWESLTPTWRCTRCENRTPVEFAECYVCGDPAPPGAHRPEEAAAGPPGPPGAGPPGPPGAGPPGPPQAGAPHAGVPGPPRA